MGFEDEVEQSVQRPCGQTKRPVQADMRTHLIHRPARDVIPPSVELDVPPIAFDSARSSCRHGFPGPAELGAVHPDSGMDRPCSNRVNGNAAEAQLIRERERAMTDIAMHNDRIATIGMDLGKRAWESDHAPAIVAWAI
jgi:hypothetical protein